MARVIFVEMRECGAGEAVRDGVPTEWRWMWIVRGVGEYCRGGKSVRLEPGWVVLRVKGQRDLICFEDFEDGRWMEVGFEMGDWNGKAEGGKDGGRIRGVGGKTRGVAALPPAAWGMRGELPLGRLVERGDLMESLLGWVWGHRGERLEGGGREVVGEVGGSWKSGCGGKRGMPVASDRANEGKGDLVEGNDERVWEAVLEGMFWVFVSGKAGVAEPPRVVLPAVVERAVAWLRARLNESPGDIFSNKEIAEAAGCSVPWLQFLFKRHFGWYPVQVARRARLDRAVELLVETEYPVAVVAAMCGFVHASHLSLHLRKHLGEDASGIRGKARAGTLRVRRLSPLTGRLVDLGRG